MPESSPRKEQLAIRARALFKQRASVIIGLSAGETVHASGPRGISPQTGGEVVPLHCIYAARSDSTHAGIHVTVAHKGGKGLASSLGCVRSVVQVRDLREKTVQCVLQGPDPYRVGHEAGSP